MEISALADDGTFRQLGLTGPVGNNQRCRFFLSFQELYIGDNRIGGIVVCIAARYYVCKRMDSVSNTTLMCKSCFSLQNIKFNDISLYVNGVEVDWQ